MEGTVRWGESCKLRKPFEEAQWEIGGVGRTVRKHVQISGRRRDCRIIDQKAEEETSLLPI